MSLCVNGFQRIPDSVACKGFIFIDNDMGIFLQVT